MNSLTVYEKMPDPIAACREVGTMFAKSGMFGADTEAKGFVLALTCFTEKLSPLAVKRTYHIVEGNLAMRADAMLAEFRSRGGQCKWLSELADAEQAKAHFKYKENDAAFTYTIKDAEREGLIGKKNWKNSTPDMLRARLISKVIRMIAPEIVAGVYTPEEISAGVADAPTVSTNTPGPLLSSAPPVEAEIVQSGNAPSVNLPPPGEPCASNQQPSDGPMREVWLPRMVEICEPHAAAVNAFLLKKGWITEGQTYRDVNGENAATILKKSASFIAKANELAGKKA